MIVSVQKWYSQEEIGEVYQWILRATYADIQKIPSLKELKELMQGIAGCMSQRETVSVKQYSKPIRESLSLIEKNYKSNISLEEICEEVAVSKNYFCYLFKRETGMNTSLFPLSQEFYRRDSPYRAGIFPSLFLRHNPRRNTFPM